MRTTYGEVAKNELKLTIINHTNTFAPRNPSKLFFSQFVLWIARNATYSVTTGQISALCATYCTSYVLKAIEKVQENLEFLGILDILTPTTPNLYIVLASKLKHN